MFAGSWKKLKSFIDLFKIISRLDKVGARDLIDSGLVLVAQNHFQEAYGFFEKASQLEPKSVTVSIFF